LSKKSNGTNLLLLACPEVETHAITAEHEFIVLACDGIWDVMSNQEVVDFCRDYLVTGIGPDRVCEKE
jgi:protein phosphatase 2C family protein 2/3